ncbi:zinc metalloprotease HtpX [soil metagenome]
MTLYTQVASNRFKTAFYLGLFSLIFLGVGWAVAWYFDMPGILVIASIIVITQGIVSFWFSDSIALAASQAQPLSKVLSPTEDARVRRLTENLCITAGLKVPRLYIIPDTALNAFATGRNQDHAAVALTAGLVQQLDDNELSGVIAHELSHIGNEDIKLMSMVMVMAGLIALVSDLGMRSMFYGGGRKRSEESGNGGVMLLVAIALAILAPIAATLIQLAISRKREFMADATAVLITRYPEGLISALKKIGGDAEPLEVANRGNAFMYFSNPLNKQFMAGLFATHPPVAERIKALEQGTGISA